jgi:hypothetical protein
MKQRRVGPLVAALVLMASTLCKAIFKTMGRRERRCAAHVGAAAAHHSGLLRFSVNEENMMLKLILILSSSFALASTECCR